MEASSKTLIVGYGPSVSRNARKKAKKTKGTRGRGESSDTEYMNSLFSYSRYSHGVVARLPVWLWE